MRAVLTLVLAGQGLAACSGAHPPDGADERAMPHPSIEEVLRRHTGAWISVPGVVGTAIGRCDGLPCIKILVAQKTRAVEEKIPASAEGYPVRVEVTGPFRARE
jgi:hypothetical protein